MSNHNPVKTFLSVFTCRFTRWCLRVARRGGTSFPGVVACFFDKKILEVVSEGMEIIVVTGTNGKTTTATLTYNLLESLGYAVALISTIRILIDGKENKAPTLQVPQHMHQDRHMYGYPLP